LGLSSSEDKPLVLALADLGIGRNGSGNPSKGLSILPQAQGLAGLLQRNQPHHRGRQLPIEPMAKHWHFHCALAHLINLVHGDPIVAISAMNWSFTA
jgi:hypothetical protein